MIISVSYAGTGSHAILAWQDKSIPCLIGARGVAHDKCEGDEKTPLGIMPIRRLWYRPDRVTLPPVLIPSRPITPQSGWCDDAQADMYNKPITLPVMVSYERLYRDDPLYDIFLELGYNDAPPIAGKGSAIFLHLTKPAMTSTKGCIAIDSAAMHAVLPQIRPGDRVEVRLAARTE